MKYGVGIDTGGTYTDAVLVNLASGSVLESVKALTTRHDLSIGILKALGKIATLQRDKHPGTTIDLVGLSTTLATNAIVEGNGGRVCLILIGYDPALLHQHGFDGEFITQNIAYVAGGYDLYGNESSPLDEDAVRRAVTKNKDHVEAFGVSCFFASRNPGHEIRSKEIIEELCERPVTCAHEITTKLNSVLRAQTVAINASLIPLLRSLIICVQNALSALSISAPLLVVKGDGSLVKADRAIRSPVETILSGPAASMVGAQHLSNISDCWVVDIGGTTTDIGKVTQRRINLNKAGSAVAGRRTMVESADIYTIGLGGDSLIRVEANGTIRIGPKRVVPLCLLAESYPMITDRLRRLSSAGIHSPSDGFFALFLQASPHELSEESSALLEKIKKDPLLLSFTGKERHLFSRRLEHLEKLCLIVRAGFTPTDALHVMGDLHLWQREAALLGAIMLAEKCGQSPEYFCRDIVNKFSEEVATAMVSKIITNRLGSDDWKNEKTAHFFLDAVNRQSTNSDMRCRLQLMRPIVAIGAPAAAYMGKTSAILDAQLILPTHGEVANAVGAIVGLVFNRIKILIAPLEGVQNPQQFRAHLPNRVEDFSDLEAAVDCTIKDVSAYLKKVSEKSGAASFSIQIEREDRIVQGIYLCTEISFTATGRPATAA